MTCVKITAKQRKDNFFFYRANIYTMCLLRIERQVGKIEMIGLFKFFLECYRLDVSVYLFNAEEGHMKGEEG
jgi:hypothetical protein